MTSTLSSRASIYISVVTARGICPHCVGGLLEARMAWVGRLRFDAEPYIGISNARDASAAVFLQSRASHWLSIDDDQAWTVADAEKLIELDVDVALGVYGTKDVLSEPVLRPVPKSKPAAPFTTESGGAGFQLVKRGAIVRMFDEYWNLGYLTNNGTSTRALHMQYFNRKGVYQGEDTAFHCRWREIGGQIWVHPEVEIGHWDGTRLWYPKW